MKADKITTVRLPIKTRLKLETLARVGKKTISETMIEAIEWHYDKEESELDSYTLGLPYFGKHSLGSDLSDLSTTYKQRIKERLREKHEKNTKEPGEFRA